MPVIDFGMDNLYQVDDGLYRSEQPTQQDFHNLKSLNFSEVLNLRQFHSDNDEAAGTHLTLHRIRMDAGKVTESELIEALRIIKQRNGSMLIHCWHGADRTGVAIAAYRIVFNNWSKQMALDEMLNGGFGYHATIYPDLVKLIENLDVDRIRSMIDSEIAGIQNR